MRFGIGWGLGLCMGARAKTPRLDHFAGVSKMVAVAPYLGVASINRSAARQTQRGDFYFLFDSNVNFLFFISMVIMPLHSSLTSKNT